MRTNIATILVFATLVAYAVADRDEDRTRKDYENSGYLEIGGDRVDRSGEDDASVSEEGGACDRSIGKGNSHEDYERDVPYEKGNHRRNGYSSKASAASSADTSANTYERDHNNRPSI